MSRQSEIPRLNLLVGLLVAVAEGGKEVSVASTEEVAVGVVPVGCSVEVGEGVTVAVGMGVSVG